MSRACAPTGYSLLEVVLAAAICAGVLVPALSMMRDGITLGERIDARHVLLVYGVSKMEEQLAIVGANWSTGLASGDFSADGHPSIRFSVARSDSPLDGGIAGRLMGITVITYRDDNGNDALDLDEMRTTLRTKVGKLVSYESKASG
jgi:hypothetical protein